MKFLQFLLLVITLAHASVVRHTREAKDIPTTRLRFILGDGAPGLRLYWNPIDNTNRTDPVIGYKVKIWEAAFTNFNGCPCKADEKKLVKKEGLIHLPDEEFSNFVRLKNVTIEPYKVIVVEGSESRSAIVEDTEVGRGYKAMVQVLTKTGEGPLSNFVGKVFCC